MAIVEGVQCLRSWLPKVDANDVKSLAPFKELHPCEVVVGRQNCPMEAHIEYIKEQTYTHHASSSVRIRADGHPMAVLDKEVQGQRHGKIEGDGCE